MIPPPRWHTVPRAGIELGPSGGRLPQLHATPLERLGKFLVLIKQDQLNSASPQDSYWHLHLEGDGTLFEMDIRPVRVVQPNKVETNPRDQPTQLRTKSVNRPHFVELEGDMNPEVNPKVQVNLAFRQFDLIATRARPVATGSSRVAEIGRLARLASA